MPPKPNSLSDLAEKLIAPLPFKPDESDSWEMSIADLKAAFVGVPISRIYEVLGILESILAVSKIGWEIYRWNGLAHLPKALAFLRATAERLDMPAQMKALAELKAEELLIHAKIVREKKRKAKDTQDDGAEPGPSKAGGDEDSGKDKPGLQVVCQKLLMIFLLEPEKPMTLKSCNKIISQGKFDLSRRLYSFAKVFAVLQLLMPLSVHTMEKKERAYRYCGPDIATVAFTEDDIYRLPFCRKSSSKHMFAVGLECFGLPMLPTCLPGFETMRVTRGPCPVVTAENESLIFGQTDFAEIKEPLTAEEILEKELKRMRIKPLSEPENSADLVEMENQEGELFQVKTSFAILPGQKSFDECFNTN